MNFGVKKTQVQVIEFNLDVAERSQETQERTASTLYISRQAPHDSPYSVNKYSCIISIHLTIPVIKTLESPIPQL